MDSSKKIAINFNNYQFKKIILEKSSHKNLPRIPKYFSLGFNTYFGNLLNYKFFIMNFQN